jgi:AraC-like DNA-binding protein
MLADSIPFSTVLLARLGDLRVDVRRVLARAELSATRLQGPNARLTTREFFAFWRAVDEVAAQPGLGLALGSKATPHQLDLATMAALHSANLGEALAKLARYKRLICPEEVAVETVRGEVRVAFRWLLADAPVPRLIVDGTFASTLNVARRGTGEDVAALRIELTRARGPEAALLESHFRCPIRHEAREDRLVLAAELLAAPFVTHNPELVAALVPGLDRALAERSQEATLAAEVRSALVARMCGERPTIEKVAKALGMSSRTLQRRLEEHGTNFRRLLDEARHEAARHMLATTALDPGEIAFLLGFEELNSFTRAFHGWEGTTPIRWRAHRGAAAS